MAKKKRNKNTTTPPSATFVAGCGRSRQAPSDVRDIAYRRLEFPECATCRHRVSPDDAEDFCVWRPETQKHPFASLADFPL